jgi:(E)-4-hydroxy-3-methylbut-2-enyl-diphosphate synthase
VTEAGEGEDGRIKSAMGIGALLADGIGDTVRVSLTEPPEYEIPVAQYIIQYFQNLNAQFDHWLAQHKILHLQENITYDPFEFNRRPTLTLQNIGSHEVPRVIADFSKGLSKESDLAEVGYVYDSVTDKWNMLETGADYVFLANQVPGFMLPNGLRGIVEAKTWETLTNKTHFYPYFESIDQIYETSAEMIFVELTPEWILSQKNEPKIPENAVIILNCRFPAIQIVRSAITQLDLWHCKQPLIFKSTIEPKQDLKQTWEAVFQITAACMTGPLVVDGRIDGLWFTASELFPKKLINQTAFSILQAGRLRITKTEYISCPSCGRTLFDLQETTAMIRKRTEHLKGVKIGIMGCIVNGPGEMADADFGYVGSGPGIITLYKGKKVVERAVKTEEAVDKLIELIKSEGKWIEPT